METAPSRLCHSLGFPRRHTAHAPNLMKRSLRFLCASSSYSDEYQWASTPERAFLYSNLQHFIFWCLIRLVKKPQKCRQRNFDLTQFSGFLNRKFGGTFRSFSSDNDVGIPRRRTQTILAVDSLCSQRSICYKLWRNWCTLSTNNSSDTCHRQPGFHSLLLIVDLPDGISAPYSHDLSITPSLKKHCCPTAC